MKVLHVLDHSLPHTDGYAIRAAEILRFQTELGLSPFALTSPFHPQTDPISEEVIQGTRHFRTPSQRRTTPIIREISSMGCLRSRLRGLVRTDHPQLLHAHSSCLWGLASLQVARPCDLPFVYEIRSFWEDGAVDEEKTSYGSLRYRITRGLESYVARRADAVVTIAQRMKEELTQRGIPPEKIFVVPNAVDPDRFKLLSPDKNLRAELGLNGSVTLGYIGSFYRWEGVDEVIQAMPLMLRRTCDPSQRFKLLIVGRGNEEQRLRNLTSELGLCDHVTFVGAVPNSNIDRYYSVLDILVYPRRLTRLTDHVTPLKPLEAMAMGKAILASNVGGLRELIPAGIGSFYEPGNLEDLASKCLELIRDPDKRRSMGHRAREHVQTKRDWRQVVRGYLEVYDAAILAWRLSSTRGAAAQCA